MADGYTFFRLLGILLECVKGAGTGLALERVTIGL